MSQATIDDEKMREFVKDALVKLFDERKDLLRELVAEVLEDMALVEAIKEGEASEPVSRGEVFEILEGEA